MISFGISPISDSYTVRVQLLILYVLKFSYCTYSSVDGVLVLLRGAVPAQVPRSLLASQEECASLGLRRLLQRSQTHGLARSGR